MVLIFRYFAGNISLIVREVYCIATTVHKEYIIFDVCIYGNYKMEHPELSLQVGTFSTTRLEQRGIPRVWDPRRRKRRNFHRGRSIRSITLGELVVPYDKRVFGDILVVA